MMTNHYWEYPKIGTCGEECDTLCIHISRARAIPPLLIRFDGNRDGFVLGRETIEGDFEEVAFIHEDVLNPDPST